MAGSLAGRLVDALGWNLLNTAASFVLRLTSNLIMTRLLMPEAFGLLAFALVFATAVSLLTDLGIQKSIIRERNHMGPLFLRTAWTVKIARSLVIALGVLGAAVFLSEIGLWIGQPDSVLSHPQMPLLIALTALSPLLDGMVSTNWDVAVRRMKYKRIVLLEIASAVFRILFQIVFALLSPTVWALLAGTLAGNMSKVVLSHVALPGPRMRPKWDKPITNELWSFGKWIMGSSGMRFVVTNTDKLIFGAVIPSVFMGLYVIAFIWIDAGRRIMTIFVSAIGYAMTAEVLRDRPDEARRLLRKYQTIVDLLSVTGFGLLVLFGQALVTFLYTDDYADAGYLVQLLAPLLLVPRFNQLSNYLVASGNSKALFHMTTMVALATVVFILLGLRFAGFEAAVTGMVLAQFVSVPYLLTRTVSLFGLGQTLYDALFFGVSLAATLSIYVFLQPF